MNMFKLLFSSGYKDAFEISRSEVRILKRELQETKDKLARAETSAISELRIYGDEAVQRYLRRIR